MGIFLKNRKIWCKKCLQRASKLIRIYFHPCKENKCEWDYQSSQTCFSFHLQTRLLWIFSMTNFSQWNNRKFCFCSRLRHLKDTTPPFFFLLTCSHTFSFYSSQYSRVVPSILGMYILFIVIPSADVRVKCKDNNF